MAKITLGSTPKNFSHTVKIPLLEGGTGSVGMNYIYRTRTEFAEMLDELFTAAQVKPASQSTEDIRSTMLDALEKTRDSNADYIVRIADGWDLEHDFTRANVAQLCNERPGAARKIIDDYRDAILEGRLGN